MESKTCKTFEMHKALIFSVMQKQAGTVAKALLELVMNSADAGSKRIDIAITREGFTDHTVRSSIGLRMDAIRMGDTWV